MNIVFMVLMFLLAIGVLVTVHEFGHYWVARRMGVKVLKFSIGFGPSLYSWRRGADNTEYVIAAIPLGGFVKMLGEKGDEPVAPGELDRAFDRKPVSRRFAIVLAGPMFNLFFAALIYALVYMIGVPGLKPMVGDVAPNSLAAQAGLRPGERIVSVDGEAMQSWQDLRMVLVDKAMGRQNVKIVTEINGATEQHVLSFAGIKKDALNANLIEDTVGLLPYMPVTAGRVLPASAAARGGLRDGDHIAAINGQPVNSYETFFKWVQSHPNQPLRFTVKRDQQLVSLTVVPEGTVQGGKTLGRIGMELAPLPQQYQVLERLNPVSALGEGVKKTWDLSTMTLDMLWKMAKGLVSTENLGGPIAIAQFAGQSAHAGLIPFLSFLAMISVSLGILNLLPVPVLDGGHLFFYLVEMVKGSPLSEHVMARAQQVGIFMLMMLMSFSFYNDITRLLQP